MESKLKTKLEIIAEVEAHFVANPRNRALDKNKSCVYFDVDTQNKCAVGIFLKNPEWIEKKFSGLSAVEVFEKSFTCLKPEYQIEDVEFWRDLQRFHDYSKLWDSDGLTERGVKFLNYLKETYKD